MIIAGDVIDHVRFLAGDVAGDLQTDTEMLRLVTRAAREISRRARCLHRFGAYPLAEGQYAYGLPSDFLQMEVVRCSPETPGDYSWALRRARFEVVVAAAETQASIYSSWAPTIYNVGQPQATIEKFAGEVLRVNGNVITVAGTHQVVVGDIVLDVQDNDEVAFVTSAGRSGGETTIVHDGLPRALEAEDEIRVTTATAPLQALYVAPMPQKDDSDGYESLQIYYSYQHPAATSLNDDLVLDTEFESALEYLTLYYLRTAELGAEDRTVQMAMRDYQASFREMRPKVLARVRQDRSAWEQGISLYRKGDFTYRVRGSGFGTYTIDNDIGS